MSKLALDRDRLHDAINMCTAKKLYAWSTTLNVPPKLNSIGIRGIGEVKLPLDSMRVVDLSNRLAKQQLETHTVVVEASDLYEVNCDERKYNEVLKDLAMFAITEMFNVDTLHFSFNVHAVLDKLVICNSNSFYKGFFNDTKQPGVFGSLILQIPVKGAIGGACVEVQYDRETISMEHDVYSETNYHLTAVAGKRIDAAIPQEFTIKPANRWYCVLLIAKLVWEDVIGSSLSIEADRFPQFVEAAFQSNEALSGWRHLVKEGTADDIANNKVRYVNTNAINPTGHFFIKSQVKEELPLLDASQTKALCIPLRNNYCIDNFNVLSLTSDDALINRILTSIKYLTVDVVLIKKQSFPTTDWRENALVKTEEFVHVYKPCSKESAELLPLQLTTGENFIGNLRAGIKCSKFQKKNCSSCRGNAPCCSFYAVFLIQPRGLNKATVIRATNFLSLNIIINRTANDGYFDEVLALVNGLDSKDIRSTIIDRNKQRGWMHWKDTLFYKVLMGSHISRVFSGIAQLALDCHHLNCNDGVVAVSVSMVELLISSVLGGGSRAALPYVIDFMKAFEILVPSPSAFVRTAKETLQNLTQAHLATIIQQSKSAENAKYLQIIGDLLLERSFKELTPDLIFGVAKVFLTLDDFDLVTSLWKKVCDDAKAEDGNLLHSMIATPKEDHGRIALVTHLASFSEYTKEALDVVVDKLQTTNEIAPDTLAELFLFFTSAESNVSLANEARMDKFITFMLQLELDIVCQLPKKLCREYGDQPISGLHILKKLIETLLTQHFRKILRLENVDVVVEFIESIFKLYDENLTDLLVKQVLSWVLKADVCFRSIALNRHVISLLRTPEKLEDESSRRLITLWIQHVEHFNKILGLSGSTLSKALFISFPCTATVNEAFERLLSNTHPHSLINFLREVCSKKVEGSTKVEGRKYRDVLAPAFKKLLKENEYLRRTPHEKLLPIMKVAVWIDDKAIVQALSPHIAHSKQHSVGKLIIYHDEPVSIETDEIFIPEGEAEAPECVPTASTVANEIKATKNYWETRDGTVPCSKKLKKFLLSTSKSEIFGPKFKEEEEIVALGKHLERMSEMVRFKVVKEGNFLRCLLFKKSEPANTDAAQANAMTEEIVQPSAAVETMPKNTEIEAKELEHVRDSNEGQSQQRQDMEMDISVSPPTQPQTDATGETWCIEDAVVTQNKVFEDFLRSDAQSQRFPRKPFREIGKAKFYREMLLKISPWPVDIEINMSNGAYYCDVTKTKKKQSCVINPPNFQTTPPPIPFVNQQPSYPFVTVPPIVLHNPLNPMFPFRVHPWPTVHPSHVVPHSTATSSTEPASKRLKTDSHYLH